MSKTARELIIDALRTCGAISSIETPNSNEIFHGLGELNGLVEQLDLDNLFPYTQSRVSFSTQAGKGRYTMGLDTSDITTERANKLVSLALLDGSQYIPLREYTINQYYSAMRNEENGTPSAFAYESTFPESEVVLYPTPNASQELELRFQYKINEYVFMGYIYINCVL